MKKGPSDLRVPLPIIKQICEEPHRDHLYISQGGNILMAQRIAWNNGDKSGVSFDFSYFTEKTPNYKYKYQEGDKIGNDKYEIVIEKIICEGWYEVIINNDFNITLTSQYFSERDLNKIMEEINEF